MNKNVVILLHAFALVFLFMHILLFVVNVNPRELKKCEEEMVTTKFVVQSHSIKSNRS